MKAYGEWIAPSFLTSALDVYELPTSGSCRLKPVDTAPGTLWIGEWVGLKAGLSVMEKRKHVTLLGILIRPSSLWRSHHTN
jgi:hypothetical protein